MNPRFIDFYMDIAARTAELSRANRLQVGAVVVKDEKIISFGYNGTPAGWDNNCEDKVYMDNNAGGWLSIEDIQSQWPYEDSIGRYTLKTKTIVLHAERNALDKLAKSVESGENALLFVTHSPCLECAKSIYGSGIKEVYYRINYRSKEGIEFLNRCGILVHQV